MYCLCMYACQLLMYSVSQCLNAIVWSNILIKPNSTSEVCWNNLLGEDVSLTLLSILRDPPQSFSPAFLSILAAVCFPRVAVSIWCVKSCFTVSFTFELVMVTIPTVAVIGAIHLKLLTARITSGQRDCHWRRILEVSHSRCFKPVVQCKRRLVADSDLCPFVVTQMRGLLVLSPQIPLYRCALLLNAYLKA